MTLILLRHTRPDGAEGVCYGATELLPDAGFEADAARILAGLDPPLRLVSSPLRRCRLLARRVAERFGLSVETDARITEMDFGAWEGRRWDALPRAELDAWAADFFHARPHGGETVAELRDRVADALRDHRAAGPALLITHAGVLKAAAALTGDKTGWDRSFAFGESLSIG